MDDRADALALVHEVEGVVDLFEPHGVRDHLVDLDLAFHVLLDHARQLSAALDAAEGGAHPLPAGDQLERARRDLAPGLKEAMAARYLAALPDLDRAAFETSCAVLAAQRNAKIVGIFTRLWKRDGKPGEVRDPLLGNQ